MEVPAHFCNVSPLRRIIERPSGSKTSANYSTTIAAAGHPTALDAGYGEGAASTSAIIHARAATTTR